MRGQRGGHDGLVEGGEQHAEQQGADGDEDVPGHVFGPGTAGRPSAAFPVLPCASPAMKSSWKSSCDSCDTPIVVGVTGYGLSNPHEIRWNPDSGGFREKV